MPTGTFFRFVLPSLVAMALFIALPIGSVTVQSLFVQHEKVLVTVETCGPFNCTEETRVDAAATAALKEAEPLGRFAGLATYFNRNHLASDEVRAILADNDGPADIARRLYNLPFYKALAFTLAYTFVVTPAGMLLGFTIALAVNAIPKLLKGPVIFFSLLPLIVTPLIGSLVLYWMLNADGILGATLQRVFDDPDLSIAASPALTWLALMFYGTWSMAPFSFVVFYAGLQSVPSDTLESAMIDGASRLDRVRFVVLPHLAPLVTFVALVQIMDNFRVFEPIVGFAAEAHATSLSWAIFNDLRGQSDQLFGSAAATSVLTVLGVVVLLMPVLVRAWGEHRRKAA